MNHQGEHYNLKEIYDEINRAYFDDTIDLDLRWFGSKTLRPRRSLLLGSYHRKKRLIKIHRLLDQTHVPSYFIHYIMYHEMLHHVEPPLERLGRRRRIHHGGFRSREKEFKDYVLAQEFRQVIRDQWFQPHGLRSVRKKRQSRSYLFLKKMAHFFTC